MADRTPTGRKKVNLSQFSRSLFDSQSCPIRLAIFLKIHRFVLASLGGGAYHLLSSVHTNHDIGGFYDGVNFFTSSQPQAIC
jgi:hypothetical protein